jgi:hypothetical protein
MRNCAIIHPLHLELETAHFIPYQGADNDQMIPLRGLFAFHPSP